jgi:RNA polymerase sigma-70 factor (ECF subfamily)
MEKLDERRGQGESPTDTRRTAPPPAGDATADDDIELLRRWRLGDHAAAERLVSRHSAMLRGFLRRKLPIEADDILQETFVALFTGVRFCNVSSARSLRAFLVRTALHQALARRRRRRTLVPFDEGDHALIVEGRDYFRDMALDWAFQRLGADMRHLFRLTFWESLTRAQIAARLGIPEGTVSTRLYRAKQQLRCLIVRFECDLSGDNGDEIVASSSERFDGSRHFIE